MSLFERIKARFTRKPPKEMGMFMLFVTQLSTAPLGQLDRHWSDKCLKLSQDPSKGELDAYDLLVEINEKACCGVSSFVHTLTDVKRFYPRPEA